MRPMWPRGCTRSMVHGWTLGFHREGKVCSHSLDMLLSRLLKYGHLLLSMKCCVGSELREGSLGWLRTLLYFLRQCAHTGTGLQSHYLGTHHIR